MRDKSTQNEIANGIRYVYNLVNRKPPELILSSDDENEILTLCRKTIQPSLLNLFEIINATDKILPLVLCYATDINTFAMILNEPVQVDRLKLDAIILRKCNLTLELRSKILGCNWLISYDSEDETSILLLEKICKKCPTLASFRLQTYDDLKEQFLNHATLEQQKILEKIWLDDNDLRTKIKNYGLPLTLIKTLEDDGIKSIDDISEKYANALMTADEKRMKEQLEKSNCDKQTVALMKEQHAKFKSNLTRLLKEETKKGQQEKVQEQRKTEENKACTTEAMKSIQDLQTKLKAQTSKQIEDSLKSVAEKLNVDWKFSSDELNQPNELVKKILDDLNNVNSALESACGSNYKTDEEIVSHVSSGIALYGIQLSDPERLGEKAQKPLLSCPLHCPLLSPRYAFQSDVQKFTSAVALNRFRKAIETSGLSVALSLEASAWGASVKAGVSRNKEKTSDQTKQTKSQSTILIQTEYVVKPVKSFRIPREEIRLSSEAESALRVINTVSKAKEFLSQFNSHVSDGIQHIGGIFIRTVQIETKDETEVETLENIASKSFGIDAGVGYVGYAFGGVSVEHFTANGSKDGTQEIKRTANVKRSVYCMGPDCTNMELFTKTLNSNNSTWYIIDRDTLSSFIPIWEIIMTSYFSESDLCQAANFIKQAWLREASMHKDVSVIQNEIQRVLINDYNFVIPKLPPSLHNGDTGQILDPSATVKKLDDEIQISLGDNFTISELNSSELLSKVINVFETVSLTSYLHGYDFIPLIIQQPSMKSLLLGIARWSEEEKVHCVFPVLANAFTEEKLQQLSVYGIHLQEEVLNLLRKVHNAKKDKSLLLVEPAQSEFDNILSIPIIPLEQLPNYLMSLMQKWIDQNNFSPKCFQDTMVIYISKSFQQASKQSHYAQQLQLIQKELINDSWLNELDGFSMDLTKEGIKSLLSTMSEIFIKKEGSQSESLSTTTDPLPVSMKMPTEVSNASYTDESDVSAYTPKKDNRILHTYNDWHIDRPISKAAQSIQRLIDILRHRLDIESLLFQLLVQQLLQTH